MEHMFFEVQLCIKIFIFKEKHVFDILINLCLLTGLISVMYVSDFSQMFFVMDKDFAHGWLQTFK